MRKVCSLAFVATLVLSQIASLAQTAAPTVPPDELMTVTLYSPAKYRLTNTPPLPGGRTRPDFSRTSFNFTSGKLNPRKWDLSYGNLGDSLLVGFGVEDDNSAIKDLGRVGWNDKFKVPVLPPLPELKPGESRYITLSPKGPARGLPSDVRGAPSARDEITGPTMMRNPDDWPQFPPPVGSVLNGGGNNAETSITMGPPNSKRSKPAPVVASVVMGHMYVIHVVKAQADFYVLVHVDGLVPRDNCTISWKRIPSPKK
jgi:hypothetical protein